MLGVGNFNYWTQTEASFLISLTIQHVNNFHMEYELSKPTSTHNIFFSFSTIVSQNHFSFARYVFFFLECKNNIIDLNL